MQYNFINNITSKEVKGSAIFGIFTDKSIKALNNSLKAPEAKKIKDAINKSPFEGKLGQKLSIYESLGSKIDKAILVGLGDKKDYNEKKFIQAVNVFCKICKEELLENIHFDTNSFTVKKIGL